MSLSGSNSSITLIPFDGKDFALWKIKVLAYIDGRGWSASITSNATPTDEQKYTEHKSKYMHSLLTPFLTMFLLCLLVMLLAILMCCGLLC
jgi:hypothetical protein